MLNELVRGVTQKLAQAFGDSVPVYAEHPAQGHDGPYFFVRCGGAELAQVAGNRYARRQTVEILYLPPVGQTPLAEMNDAGDRLFDALALVDAGAWVRGTRLRCEMQGNTLRFFVNYCFHVLKDKEKDPYMETLRVEERTKR